MHEKMKGDWTDDRQMIHTIDSKQNNQLTNEPVGQLHKSIIVLTQTHLSLVINEMHSLTIITNPLMSSLIRRIVYQSSRIFFLFPEISSSCQA